MSLTSICVFCASSSGVSPTLLEAAKGVGAGLAERGLRVVYGGGGSGLMGAVAEGVMGAGGEAIGVIPDFMVQREWGREDLTELHVVRSMHERKAMMADLSDAFVVLPGGIGTLEEFFEVWTWRQIGLHGKPVGLLDLPTAEGGGFWQPLISALTGLVDAGFVSRASLDDLVIEDDLDAMLTGLAARGSDPQLLRPGT